MDHEQACGILPGYIDNELTLSETLAFERHLSGCERCQQALRAQQGVSTRLRGADLRFDAPASLRERIDAACRPRKSAVRRVADWLSGRTAGGRAAAWAPAGALAVSVAALALSAGLYVAAPSAQTRLSEELVDNHVRSLQLNHLIDVVSTDRHTVKPWFDGKLDFAPPVLDLARDGYPLAGGRLDYVNGRAVAVLVYHYKLHLINLYVWPGHDAGTHPRLLVRQGYHLAHWTDGHMDYWAVTDAGESELTGFIKSWQAHANG